MTSSGEDVVIPPGTVVGMSYSFVHQSPRVFKDPMEFIPERWLSEDAIDLEGWILTFSKGPRNCLGQNLAMCELYLVFATLFRRFHITYDGGKVDFRDCFLPRYNSDHVRAFFKPVAMPYRAAV